MVYSLGQKKIIMGFSSVIKIELIILYQFFF